MAIKIIENGKPSKPIYLGECYYCKCKFEFAHEDANEYLDDQREGESYNVTCPYCKRKVWVKKNIFRYEEYVTLAP